LHLKKEVYVPYQDIVLTVTLYLLGAGLLLLVLQLLSDSLIPIKRLMDLLLVMSVWKTPEYRYPKYKKIFLDEEYKIGKAIVNVYALREITTIDDKPINDRQCPKEYKTKQTIEIAVDGNGSLFAPSLNRLAEKIVESVVHNPEKIRRHKLYKD
jgi:hypothetical protein